MWGKVDALERGNYRGLKLAKQAIKIPEIIVDDSQFCFVPRTGTTDASPAAAGKLPSSEQAT